MRRLSICFSSREEDKIERGVSVTESGDMSEKKSDEGKAVRADEARGKKKTGNELSCRKKHYV